MRIIRISDAQTRAGLPCNDAGIDCEQHAGVENTFDSTIRPHTMAPSMRIAEEECGSTCSLPAFLSFQVQAIPDPRIEEMP